MKKTALLSFALLALSCAPLHAQEKGRPPQNVIVARAHLETFVDTVEALGTLRANETVVLTATVTETITAVNFEDNQRVETGDVLVEMKGGQEKAELDAERATAAEALRQVKRLEPLVATGAASRSELDLRQREYQTAAARLKAVQSRIGDRIITAPFAGVTGLRNISVGAVVQPGTRITTLDDDSVMKLDFSVPSIFLETLKPGLEISATTRAFEGREFKGKIASIDSQIDPVTRSILVRAIIPNEEKLLKPGLLMSVEIMKNPRQAIVIPEEAIVPEARKNFVFTVSAGGAHKREVKTGARRPGQVEILEGLKGGELVVTHGTMTVSDGAPVNVTAEDKGGQSIGKMLEKGEKPSDKGAE